jgi:subtilisin
MFSCINSIKIKNLVFIFCTILILNISALAADRDVIIGYNKPVGLSEKELVNSHGGSVKKDFHLINAVSARMSEVEIEKMKKDPGIKYVVNDSIFQAADEYTSSWGVQYIGSQPVHNQGINGAGVKIAVLDTGIDYDHPDLNNSYKGGYDFVNNDADPWDDNCLTYLKTCHGTHVSGIIAAEHNGIGVVGVAPGASIYAVKVLDAGGFGAASLVVSGIEWAMNNNMSIISMSIESTENNTAVFEAVNAAYNSGILVVAAGGNTNGRPVLYPAAYDSVIAVTAIDLSGQRASFSPIDPKIEVAAPGVSINSTVCIIADLSHCLQNGYGLLNGTSMAAPHVTGVAALIFSTNFPDVNHDGKKDNKDVREIIRNSAFDAGVPGKDDVYGYGIVDASKALLGISTFSLPPVIMDFAPSSPVNNPEGSSRTFNITINQTVNVIWYINGTRVSSNTGVTNAKYTNTSAKSGIWNVSAIATNVNGSVMLLWVWNVMPKPSPSPTPFPSIHLTLTRTKVPPGGDMQEVILSKGKYSINIHNVNLTEVDMKVYVNGVLQKRLSRDVEFNKKRNDINFDLTVNNALVAFIPYGKKGSIADIEIKR